jgi:hypothetical protein
MYAARHLQDFVNATCKFNSIVVKTPKLVLCFSRDGVSLKRKTEAKRSLVRQYASFEPIFDPPSILPDSPFKY